jgi:inner membrane protein
LDNLTHSLVGVALADLALRDTSGRTGRGLFLAAGVVASNAPDLDLLYSGTIPAPLGYLLHHRGHSHTLAGLSLLAVLVPLVWRISPATRRLDPGDSTRLLLLIWVSLAGHVLFDSLNSYGVHPFYPFNVRWYYGDAVFIFEPWLWMILGLSAGLSVQNPTARFAVMTLIAVLPIILTSVGLVPLAGLTVLVVAGAGLAWAGSRLSRRMRAAAALVATAAGCAGMLALSHLAEASTQTALEPLRRGEILDVILTPNPASPFCWSVIAVEKNAPEDTYVLRRGTLSLAPALMPATSCASFRFLNARAMNTADTRRLVWSDEIRGSLQQLRDLSGQDCWVNAWLQFGRAPVIRDGLLFDLRFDNGSGRNFTTMTLTTGRHAGCPPHVTPWAKPRADLLDAAGAAGQSHAGRGHSKVTVPGAVRGQSHLTVPNAP